MPSSSERDLFDQAIELPVDDRAAFLDRACADAALRARLEALLDAHDHLATQFLNAPSPVAEAAVSQAGRRIGAYRIVCELGRGGMGAVYLATRADAEVEKTVAIKVMAGWLADEDRLRVFKRERQILSALDHPHIARFLDAGTTEDGLPFVVMEYVEGSRIDEFVRSRGLPLPAILTLFQQVCGAVQFAHSRLVVHRDLKPHNILVTADGAPKLLDFGIATLLSQDAGQAAATRPGQLTPEYASPEQLRGEPVTTATDVYSLGVLLYELLTGVRPFAVPQTGDAPALPPQPSSIARMRGDAMQADQIAGDLDAIVLMALRPEPDRRYGSVAALSEDVERHLSGRPVLAHADAWSYRAAKFVRRHRAGVGAAAAVVLTIAAGVTATVWQARVAQRERADAVAQRALAERRFAEVRQLANSFLFEFHDAIAPLPGSTPARKLLVTRALDYLGRLAADASTDADLQTELAAAYDRVGDVQGNPTVPNIGDSSGALDSYQKAEAIRKGLTAAAPTTLASRLMLAKSDMKIGDALVGRGAIQDAVARYRAALVPREEALAANAPSRADAFQAYVETSGRLCTSLLAVGDAPGALSNCQRNRDTGDQFLNDNPQHAVVRTLRAANGIGFGNVLRMTGKPQEAAIAFADAITRLGALLADNPGNSELRRRLAVTYGFLATVQTELTQPADAAASLERAIDQLTRLAAADPANVRSGPELAYFLNRRAQALIASGRVDAARADAAKAIDYLRVATERPGAGGDAFNEYAWALVSYVPESVRNPTVALAYANKALERAGAPNPAYLHTLGWAHHLLGDRTRAVETLNRALAQLAGASGPAVGLRRQIEGDLKTFSAR